MLRPAYRFIRASFLHSLIPESAAPAFANGKQGIEVVGLFHNATGLGESARLCARQLQGEGFKVRTTSAEKYLFKKKDIDWQFENTAREDEIGLRIIHLNPPMIPPYAIGAGLKKFASVYNIGYWAWELENLPQEWIKSLSYINGLMAPSDFICKTLQRYTDKLVLKLPHSVKIDDVSKDMRGRLNILPDDFLVVSVFSVESSIERKNPEGLIAAFLKGLGDVPNAHLIFKINPLSKELTRLLELTGGHPRIKFIDDLWPRADVLGLIQSADIYASLHRSEGFGLGLAEAMMLGTPVMGTGWSGNMDFCDSDNSFPVHYTMTNVKSTHPEFSRAGMSVWAEPDIHQAAKIMRGIYKNNEEATAKAALCLQKTNHYFTQERYSTIFKEIRETTARP